MAKKPTVTTITSGYASNTQLNANFVALRDGFDNTLSLDGSTPNSMGADLDMNSNNILNAGSVAATSIILGGVPLSPSSVTVDASNVTFTPTGSISSTDVQAALAEVTTDLSASTGSSLVGFAPTGTITSTNVQAAVAEVDTDLSALTALKSNLRASHRSMSVLNVEGAALERFDLTRQGTGSGNVVQGFAVDPYLGELYTLHDTSSTGVLNKFEADGARTQTSSRWNSTPTATIGHQQLDICWDKDGTRWFWTAENYAITNATRYIKRFQVADGAGTELTISNQEQFKVWGDDVSGTGSATTAISLDGKYLVTEHSGDGTTNRVRVFDLPAMMLGGAGDYSTAALFEWTMELNTTTYPLQGMACDGSTVYIFTGNIAAGPTLKVFAYTLDGTLIQEIDDFTVGETKAQGDGAGTAYELEGAGWIWQGSQPFLAVNIASGDSGSRVNRIWAFGAKLPVTSFGSGNRPAFVSTGTNDYAVVDGQSLRLGHYNQTTDTFTEGASIDPSNQFNFTAVSGTWTPVISDATTGGNLGTATVTNAVYRNIGGMIYAKCNLANIGTAGMTGGGNIYVQGLPVAAESDSDGIMSFTGFTPDASGIGIVPSVDSGATHFKFKELISGGNYINANVNQFATGTADIWITIVYAS